MKAKTKTRIIILFILGIFFVISPIIIGTNLSLPAEFNNMTDLETEELKMSKISSSIYINDDDPSYNWSVAKGAGLCTGNGTYSEPYVIEDLIIDGGGSGSCILIENSTVYFRIENCSVYNSGDYPNSGIRLNNVNNSVLFNNTCSSNYYGIRLTYSYNNTIVENVANNNNFDGIILEWSDKNTVSENTASNNSYYGIFLWISENNTLSGNLAHHNSVHGIRIEGGKNQNIWGNNMTKCGLRLGGSYAEIASHDIDTSNLVNGKHIYYYINATDLGSSNFTNAGQVILVNCSYSLVSNLNVSDGSIGISLIAGNNNTISGNVASDNNIDGIYLDESHNNIISGNTASDNSYDGIYLYDSHNNIISGNTANNNSNYGIDLFYSDNNIISGNNASNSQYGLHLYFSDNNIISGNAAHINQEGFYVYQSDNNTITVNEANDNINTGLYLYFSNDNTVSGNSFKDNGKDGIKLDNSHFNTVSGNVANNNYYKGIHVHGSHYNIISGNIANNNEYGLYLFFSDDNIISRNTLLGNDECIIEEECEGNVFSNNKCNQDQNIPGYNYFFLLGITCIGALTLVKRLKKS